MGDRSFRICAGFRVHLLEPGARTKIGRLELFTFPSEHGESNNSDEWDVMPFVAKDLDGHGSFHVRFPQHGRHAEGYLGRQLVALIDGSKVVAIYPTSSGKPSTPTILGSYQIYRRVPGYLPDGMYYSDFFIRGYAIHGYDPAPNYPASHGCMRLPISDAISVFNWLALGDVVDVYE